MMLKWKYGKGGQRGVCEERGAVTSREVHSRLLTLSVVWTEIRSLSFHKVLADT